jgi:hypothetical protein
LQSALDERTHQAGYKPALRFGCGFAALWLFAILCGKNSPRQIA